MTNEIQMTQSFQERIFEKIRNDIGTLMTDEDIKKLVETTVERAFFQPIKRPSTGYSYRDEFDPPRIETLVRELVEPTLRKSLDAWLKEHQQEVQIILDKTLAGGLTEVIGRAFSSTLSSAMFQLQTNLQQALQQMPR